MHANKRERMRWLIIMAASVGIHAVFCAQAVSAVLSGSGSMVASDFLLISFMPHYLMIYFLPPAWPNLIGADIDWWRVAGKLGVSFPASLLYGWLAGAVWQLIHNIRCRVGGKDREQL